MSLKFYLSNEQLAAVKSIVNAVRGKQQLIGLCGYAGTGKTTITKLIARELDAYGACVCAPTNMAARVLINKGIPATTIHSKFFTPKEVEVTTDDGKIKKRLEFVPNYKIEKLSSGKRNFSQVIIIDEASMVKSDMIEDLTHMCDSLVLIGDGAQLPPVRDGKHPMGLFNTMPYTAKLTQIFRQDGESPILQVASRCRENMDGIMDESFTELRDKTLTKESILSKIPKIDALGLSWVFISQLNNSVKELNLNARVKLGYKGVLPNTGERLRANNSHSDNIKNGSECLVVKGLNLSIPEILAEILHWDGGYDYLYPTIHVQPIGCDEVVEVQINTYRFILNNFGREALTTAQHRDFAEAIAWNAAKTKEEDPRFWFGYAITCHKSQGSEYDYVFVDDSRHQHMAILKSVAHKRGYEFDSTRAKKLIARWFYTAITRGRKRVVIYNKG